MEEMVKPEEEIRSNNLFDRPDGNDSDLAGRGSRLAAKFIDGIILLIPSLILLWLVYGFNGYMENIRNLNLQFIMTTLFLGMFVDLLFNGYLLFKKGQTIGKMSMDIKIVDMNNNVPTLFKSYFLRSFLFSVIYFIPYVKLLVALDPFFIFSQNRRCLHDRLAGTKVVVAETAEK